MKEIKENNLDIYDLFRHINWLNSLARNELIYMLLLNKNIKFEEILKLYVKALEDNNQIKQKELNDIIFPASYFIEQEVKIHTKSKEQYERMKQRLSHALINTKAFEWTEFELTLKSFL